MRTAARTAVHADHVVETGPGGLPRARDGPSVVLVEDDRVTAVLDDGVDLDLDADHLHLPPGSIVLPGAVDAHTHSLNGPLFRGTTEDRSRGGDQSLVYDFLMPVGDLASRVLSYDEARDVYRAALGRALLGGTTTVLDVFRPDTTAFLDAAVEVGIRAIGAPYAASSTVTGLDEDGLPRLVPRDEQAEAATIERLHDRHDGAGGGRVTVGFGPHCTDTCSPALLRRLHSAAGQRGALLTIHAAQSRTEVRTMRERYGMTPIKYLVEHGITGPGVLLAHAVHATDEDLALLAETGTSVAVCPATFAQGGEHVDHHRLVLAGVPTALGTDGYSRSLLGDLHLVGALSKTAAGHGEVATAAELLHLATAGGAAAVQQPDIGSVRPGAKADLVALSPDPARPRRGRDPIRTLVWHPGETRVVAVFVDGECVVRDGQVTTVDLARTERRANDAVDRVWHEAERTLPLPH